MCLSSESLSFPAEAISAPCHCSGVHHKIVLGAQKDKISLNRLFGAFQESCHRLSGGCFAIRSYIRLSSPMPCREVCPTIGWLASRPCIMSTKRNAVGHTQPRQGRRVFFFFFPPDEGRPVFPPDEGRPRKGEYLRAHSTLRYPFVWGKGVINGY